MMRFILLAGAAALVVSGLGVPPALAQASLDLAAQKADLQRRRTAIQAQPAPFGAQASSAITAVKATPRISAASRASSAQPVTEVVVTGKSFVVDQASGAAKLDLPIVQTPQAISVIDHDFVEMLNLRTVAEALNYTSGVRSQAFGSDTRIEYYEIRGFQNTNLFKDGLVLYNSGAFLSWTTPTEGIDRLEVIKGPSSVLYGNASAGGIVDIVSKSPVRTPLLRVEAGGDQYGSGYGEVDVDGPVGDTLAFRGVGLIRRGDTQVALAQDNRSYAAAAVAWTPWPDTTLTVRGSFTADRSNRPTGFTPYSGFVTPLSDGQRIPIDLFVSDPSVDRYDRDQYELGYTLETRLAPDVRFVSNGRYGRIELIYAGLFGAFAGNPVRANGTYYLNRANSRQVASLDDLTVDNHLDVTFRTGVLAQTVLLGVDHSRYGTVSAVAMGTAPRLDVFAPVYDVAIPRLGLPSTTKQNLDQNGLYLQDEIKVGEVTALISTRHDWLDIASTAATRAVTRGDPDRQTYRVGVSYLTPVGLAPYVSYATSFAPTIGVEAATGRFYRPETGDAWEGGVKYQPPSAFPLLFTASAFSISRDGVLVANPVAGFPTNQSQLGVVRSQGAEAELQARPLPTLNVTASITGFDIRNRSGVTSTLGLTPTATPQFVASAFADYTLPRGLLNGLGLGIGVRHTSDSFADTANTLVVPAATVFDLAVHYDWRRLRLAANVSNLFDKAYVGACTSAGTCYAANLRRATISLAYRY